MVTLPSELKHLIHDFNKENPWKPKFDDVVNEMIHVDFQCEVCWNCESCVWCGEDLIEFNIPLSYDKALHICLDHYVGMVNPTGHLL